MTCSAPVNCLGMKPPISELGVHSLLSLNLPHSPSGTESCCSLGKICLPHRIWEHKEQNSGFNLHFHSFYWQPRAPPSARIKDSSSCILNIWANAHSGRLLYQLLLPVTAASPRLPCPPSGIGRGKVERRGVRACTGMWVGGKCLQRRSVLQHQLEEMRGAEGEQEMKEDVAIAPRWWRSNSWTAGPIWAGSWCSPILLTCSLVLL